MDGAHEPINIYWNYSKYRNLAGKYKYLPLVRDAEQYHKQGRYVLQGNSETSLPYRYCNSTISEETSDI